MNGAEWFASRGWRTNNYNDLEVARALFPDLVYLRHGPARTGNYEAIVRAIHEDPRAYDLAAALKQHQERLK